MSLRELFPVTQQFQNKNGSNLVGGKVYIYYQGRTALATTYHDEAGTVVNTNPVLLDNNGRATVFADTIYSYTIVVCDYYGKELFSQDITLHDAISTAKDVLVMGSNGSVKVDTTTLSNGVQYDLSVNTDVIATKESVAKKKDKQAELNFNGSATKTVKSITQNANGELNVEFEDINLPQEVHNLEITSEDKSVKVTETTDSQTNTKTFDLSVDRITNIASSDGSINVSSTGSDADLTLPSDVVRDSAYTHIDAATANPLTDGTAAVGVSVKYAREDHVHPTDTSREDIANKTTVVLGTSNDKYPTDEAVAKFVNSSIATNTANYISNNGEPFTSVEQLEAYSGPVTNNDYAFVTGTDSDGNTYYDRYKATVSGETVTWALEYRLNNSSFTAAQWSAINSGITSVLVAKIHEHENKAVLDGITSDKVNSWDGKEDAFDVLPTTKGGTGTNAASKSALTSSLINSLSTESSTPVDADYYVSQYQNGGTSNTSFVRRPVSALWEYIKDKISSVLGLTASSYSGKAATAGTADKAVADNSGNNIEETYATKTETEAAISNSVDQTYSPTSTKAQSGVAVNEAFKTRETSSSDDSYTYLGMKKTYGSTEALYWKLVSFNTVNNYWTLQFEVDVSNGRKSNNSYDTEIYETKRLTICGINPEVVTYASELRYAAQYIDESRGYNNNIYYEISNSNLVTVYIKAINRPNKTQICRLTSVRNFQGISNVTWHEPTDNAGTQPTNPVKFKEFFPSIASTSSDIGSDSVPVYINKGKPVSCNSSNLKAGKDDDGNVIKNTYATKTALDSRIPAPTSTTGTQVLKCINGVVQWVTE